MDAFLLDISWIQGIFVEANSPIELLVIVDLRGIANN